MIDEPAPDDESGKRRWEIKEVSSIIRQGFKYGETGKAIPRNEMRRLPQTQRPARRRAPAEAASPSRL